MKDDFRSLRKRIKKNRSLRKIMSSDNLPVLPELLSKLEKTLRDPKGDAGKIARLIESDPVIAGRLIKVANSAAFGGRSKIVDLQMAVSRLGLNMIRQLVYSLVLPEIFIDIHMVDHRQFWKHSLATANVTRKLAIERSNDTAIGELAYMTGLVHDVGILLLALGLTNEYTEVIEQAYSELRPLTEVENDILGITHSQVGAVYVVERWELDERIAEAIVQYEFVPEFDNEDPLVISLYAADSLCIAAGLPNGTLSDPEQQYPNPLQHMEKLGYDEATTESFVKFISELATSLESFLG